MNCLKEGDVVKVYIGGRQCGKEYKVKKQGRFYGIDYNEKNSRSKNVDIRSAGADGNYHGAGRKYYKDFPGRTAFNAARMYNSRCIYCKA